MNKIDFLLTPNQRWVWLVIAPPCLEDCGWYIDLVEDVPVAGQGREDSPFSWWGQEVDAVGLPDFLLGSQSPDEFALQHGIAPNQPFLARVRAPKYSVWHGPDGTEYDADYYPIEIIQRDPLPEWEAAARWAEAHFWTYQYEEPVKL